MLFNRDDTKGTNSSKFLRSMFVYVSCKFVSGLILWFMENLWFDDLRAEWIGDRSNMVFSRHVTFCGWIVSKYQLTNLMTILKKKVGHGRSRGAQMAIFQRRERSRLRKSRCWCVHSIQWRACHEGGGGGGELRKGNVYSLMTRLLSQWRQLDR